MTAIFLIISKLFSYLFEGIKFLFVGIIDGISSIIIIVVNLVKSLFRKEKTKKKGGVNDNKKNK